MQYKTFFIPASGNEQSEEQLNVFLRANKIISINREFINQQTPAWCFLVEYIEGSCTQSTQKSSKKIDYMTILSNEEFSIFSKLRTLRKQNAEKEKIPAYAVFTDEQLYKIVKAMPKSEKEMEKIEGIGPAKTEKYGSQIINALSSSISTPQVADDHNNDIDNDKEPIPF